MSIQLFSSPQSQECKRGEAGGNKTGGENDSMISERNRISERSKRAIRFGSSVSSANRPSLSFAYFIRKNSYPSIFELS